MCLVHENQDCIIDLVRNLKYLDPDSSIMLYNGGTNTALFDNFPFSQYNAIIYPEPKVLKWGWLHDFAIDCMEYAIMHLDFDLITVVDSDQLLCSKNYSAYVADTFHNNSKLGMLGQVATRIDADTKIDPAITAYTEKDLWKSFLEKLPNGKEAFLHWTFWPSTAFSYAAAVDLVRLFRTDLELQSILKKTKIWASEEILLPTLTIALGYTIVENPCVYDFVKYRAFYTNNDIQQAIQKENTFWIHPVERKINNTNRIYVRNAFKNYIKDSFSSSSINLESLFDKIKKQVNSIEGWLYEDEIALLTTICYTKAQTKKNPVLVEIGSYCGKATAVMALAAKEINSKTKVFAIDDFTGRLGAEDTRIDLYGTSFEKFQHTLNQTETIDKVTIIKSMPSVVDFKEEIDMLLIDGLHDYANVARDFYNYEKHLKPDSILLFHDYDTGFPGVTHFVTELLYSGNYQILSKSDSLVALKKTEIQSEKTLKSNIKIANKKAIIDKKEPMVSCIMPTYNRSEFITNAINQFLDQNYPNKELIIIDDSERSIADLVPESSLITYIYLNEKLNLGSKRNMACQIAKGEIIIHLDDDDYYAPDWLQKQISFLTEKKLDITGLDAPVFHKKEEDSFWQYVYPKKDKPWVYGATLCYTKQFWQANPFPATNCGEDNVFVWNENAKNILANDAVTSYLGQIHTKNTSPKQTKYERWKKLENNELVSTILNSIKDL
ncbi:Glycosyl transferase [Flavobacterium aquidurense]|uniref:Glycosyl transferase n=2 Tax=Flavobacterium aquidurense TaxID=362413 RepID=A0A0Q0RYP8_9FLAO|nr:Glycosyl transferase [Flavobacterium aquidurense]